MLPDIMLGHIAFRGTCDAGSPNFENTLPRHTIQRKPEELFKASGAAVWVGRQKPGRPLNIEAVRSTLCVSVRAKVDSLTECYGQVASRGKMAQREGVNPNVGGGRCLMT